MTDLLKQHTLNIERVAVTQGSAGGQVRSYDTANRTGGDPVKVTGRAIRMSEKEKLEHGVRGDFTAWKFLVPETNPKVTLQDRIVFDYATGESHTVKVTHASFLRSDLMDNVYKFIGQEDTTET